MQPLPDSHILDPVSQIQTEGKGEEGTEIQTTALNIYMDSSERVNVFICVCVCVCVCRFSLSTCIVLIC